MLDCVYNVSTSTFLASGPGDWPKSHCQEKINKRARRVSQNPMQRRLILSYAFGATTLPVLLVYLAALAEVRKMVVAVVPGGGVGMRLPCCRPLRPLRASAHP